MSQIATLGVDRDGVESLITCITGLNIINTKHTGKGKNIYQYMQ